MGMNVEEFLGDGEKIVHSDGRLNFTDRRLLVFYGSSLEMYPYEHISWAGYERRLSILPIILGTIMLIVGAILWVFPNSVSQGFAISLPLLSELFVAVGVAIIAIGFLSSRKALRFQMDSGSIRTYRIKDQKVVEWFAGQLPRH